MTCHVDEKKQNEVYSTCVIEFGKPEDCSHAKNKSTPLECEFWKPKTIKKRDFVHELECIASHLYPSVKGEAAQDAAYYIKQLLTEIQDLRREIKCLQKNS